LANFSRIILARTLAILRICGRVGVCVPGCQVGCFRFMPEHSQQVNPSRPSFSIPRWWWRPHRLHGLFLRLICQFLSRPLSQAGRRSGVPLRHRAWRLLRWGM